MRIGAGRKILRQSLKEHLVKMFGSIGHAACNTKSLSQGAGGNIDEVQPDNGVVFLVVLADGVPWGRMAFKIGINFSKVHQLRSRKKSSLE